MALELDSFASEVSQVYRKVSTFSASEASKACKLLAGLAIRSGEAGLHVLKKVNEKRFTKIFYFKFF